MAKFMFTDVPVQICIRCPAGRRFTSQVTSMQDITHFESFYSSITKARMRVHLAEMEPMIIDEALSQHLRDWKNYRSTCEVNLLVGDRDNYTMTPINQQNTEFEEVEPGRLVFKTLELDASLEPFTIFDMDGRFHVRTQFFAVHLKTIAIYIMKKFVIARRFRNQLHRMPEIRKARDTLYDMMPALVTDMIVTHLLKP